MFVYDIFNLLCPKIRVSVLVSQKGRPAYRQVVKQATGKLESWNSKAERDFAGP